MAAVTVCSDFGAQENKRRLLLRRKVIRILDMALKSRGITLLMKVCLVKAIVFSVVMDGCDSFTIKKNAEEFMLLNCDAGEDS